MASPTEPGESAALFVPDRRTGPEERRTTLRHPFTAAIQIIETTAGLRLMGRISDLSEGGCFVDIMSPLDTGLRTHVRIRKGEESVEAVGIVRYSKPGMGMGIEFVEVSDASRRVLERWLQPDHASTVPDFDAPQNAAPAATAVRQSDREILQHLVDLLVRKQILTEAESLALLRDRPAPPAPNPF